MTLIADFKTRSRSRSVMMGTSVILLLLVTSTWAQEMMEEEEMLNKEWIEYLANYGILFS